MDCVLDLDLDFFVSPIEHWPEGERLSESDHRHATQDEVRTFLEQKCHLSRDSKILGREVVEHEDAFWTWREWRDQGKLSPPFRVTHVDAHADLGMGCGGWKYLLTELLAFPVEQRARPCLGTEGLNSGNYLTFAVANRWISQLTYVFPNFAPNRAANNHSIAVMIGGKPAKELPVGIIERSDLPNDLMPMHFRDQNPKSGLIELKRYRPEDASALLDERRPSPISVEPAVPFNLIAGQEFESSGFTHMILAQSPRYTTASADQLLPVIREYFDPE